MPDTTDNVIFEVYGNTAEFATDYGTSGIGFTSSHVQIVKLDLAILMLQAEFMQTTPYP